ncbi:hypothetical protein [Bdellovibrio sp. GT3]|uniref:hypothetical protein n=1 Tax=Bdellovibrio sp. GT3 TaxID=3136282 RepID=UPI0030EFB87D
MRLLFFVLTLVTSAVAIAANTVGGTVALKGQQMFLKTDDPCNNYLVASNNEIALSALVKLAPGDVITATGKKNPAHCTVSIDSVEYVGLRRMLGSWYSTEAVITVEDFNSMKFYAAEKDHKWSQTPIEYNYSLVPASGKEWVMFLSDSKSTQFGTIQFSRGSAVLKMYSSDTGALNKTLILYRMTTGLN